MNNEEYVKALEEQNAYLQLVTIDMSKLLDISLDIIVKNCSRDVVKIFISAYIRKMQTYRNYLEKSGKLTKDELNNFDENNKTLQKFLES